MFTVKLRRPRSIAGRIWNLGQSVSSVALIAFIGLKLAGLIDWSWWWVPSPLWIGGILLAATLCAVLVPFFRNKSGTG
jgi:hypothetical protein